MQTINKDNNFKLKNIGFVSFKIGLFLLPTASSFAIPLFLIASVSAYISKKIKFFEDKWNFPFFAAGILMLISCFINSIFVKEDFLIGYRKDLTWLGLVNWIPYFLCFSPFSSYLKNKESRILAAKILICGTIPLLFSCIAQYWFKIYGPFELFNGLITWFQRPLRSTGVTGLFNNPNYLATWLLAIWPFCVATIFSSKRKFFKLVICLFITTLLIYFLFFTYSRNAYLGLFISLPILFGLKKTILFFLLICFILISIYFLNSFFQIFELYQINDIRSSTLYKGVYNLSNFCRDIFSEEISTASHPLYKFCNVQSRAASGITRIQIWSASLKIIYLRPILGLGIGAFTILFSNSEKITHSHNLFLEFSINYGLPSALFVFSTLIYILYLSFKKVMINPNIKNNFDLAWLTSSLLIFYFQISDVTYYDAKIGLLFWILFAGLKSLILNPISNKKKL